MGTGDVGRPLERAVWGARGGDRARAPGVAVIGPARPISTQPRAVCLPGACRALTCSLGMCHSDGKFMTWGGLQGVAISRRGSGRTAKGLEAPEILIQMPGLGRHSTPDPPWGPRHSPTVSRGQDHHHLVLVTWNAPALWMSSLKPKDSGRELGLSRIIAPSGSDQPLRQAQSICLHSTRLLGARCRWSRERGA